MYASDPMPTGPYRRLAAIVLNFRTPDDTVMAVRSLLASTRPPDDLIVVDNDAGPGCRAQVAGLHPAVRYVSAGSNLGFSGGMNLGIRAALAAGANAVLLVNSDATVAADCVGRLESGLDGVQVGIAGPVIHDPSIERVTSSGIDYDASTGRMRERQESLIGGAVNVDAVSGCVMLTASEVFEKVGFLDDDYFFTFEDIDFCLRARVAGFRTVVIPEAVAYHVGSRTIGKASPERLYFAARNHLLLASRATRSSNPLKSMLRTSSIVSLNLAHAVTSAHGPLAGRLSAVFRGVGDYFRGQLGQGSAAPVTISPAHTRQLTVHGEVVLPKNDDHAAILMYHRIATSPGDGSLCVAPRHFRSHLQQLSEGGYNVVSLRDLTEHLTKRTLPPRSVAITFDDGYLDTLTLASPLLKEFAFPATVFAVSGALDGRSAFWWNTLDRVFQRQTLPPNLSIQLTREALNLATLTLQERHDAHVRIRSELVLLSLPERQRVMNYLVGWSGLVDETPADVRPMTASELVTLASLPGIEIGAHSANHLCLSSQPQAVVEDEVTTSKHQLERLLGRAVSTFAYPYGSHNRGVIDAVRAAGFSVAVTTEQQFVAAGADLFTLPRYEALDCERLALPSP